MTPQIDIIIPAYNEAHRIGPSLRTYLEYFDSTVRLTVVLNGCTDETAAVVEEHQAWAGDRLRMIDIPDAIGKGMAIVEGWKRSDAPLLGFVDADASTNPAEFEKLIHAMDGHDGVIASRFLPGATIVNRQSSLRTMMSHAFSAAVRLVFHMPYKDTQCGAKLFTREVITPVVDELHESSMVFDVELLWRLHQRNADVLELPTYWVDKAGSPLLGKTGSFVRTGIGMVSSLLRIKRNT